MREFLAPRYWSTWLGVFFIWALSRLPRMVRHGLGSLVASIAWKFNHKRREIVQTNLSMCFPEQNQQELDELGKAHFQAMGRSLMDTGLCWFASDKRLLKNVRVEGWEHCEREKAAGKNLIMHVAHCSGLEFGAMAIGSLIPGLGPYNAAKNKLIDRFISRSRRRFGSEVFERDDGMLAYTRALKKGKLLYTLTDEDHGPDKSVFAPFFAETKATLPIIGRLAKLSNAVVFPAMTRYDDKTHQYVTKVFPPMKDFPSATVEEDAIKLNQALEQMILYAPEEFMWTLRIFNTRPDGSRIYKYQQT